MRVRRTVLHYQGLILSFAGTAHSLNVYVHIVRKYNRKHKHNRNKWCGSYFLRFLFSTSKKFCVGNDTKQGGILSPFLFTRYIRPLLAVISTSNVGCHIGGIAVNIFAYADDIALLPPSWHALHDLLQLLDKCCKELGMLCNTNKTKCMILNLTNKTKIVSQTFPHFIAKLSFLGCFDILRVFTGTPRKCRT